MQKNKKSYLPKDLPVFLENFPKKIDDELFVVFLNKYIRNKYQFYFYKKIATDSHYQFKEIYDELVYTIIELDKTYDSMIHFLNYCFILFRNKGFQLINNKNTLIYIENYDEDILFEYDKKEEDIKKEYYLKSDLEKLLKYIKYNFNAIEYNVFCSLFITKDSSAIICRRYKVNVKMIKEIKNMFKLLLIEKKNEILK